MNNDLLKAAGAVCGVNVEALYKKYVDKKSATGGEKEGGAPPLKLSQLDNIVICKRCHGLGFIKEHYNHQVKDVNCNECAGDGLLHT
jgi:protein required for attachment to host cells